MVDRLKQRRRRELLGVLQLLGSSHPPVVLALADVEKGRRRGRSQGWDRRVGLLLHQLRVRLSF